MNILKGCKWWYGCKFCSDRKGNGSAIIGVLAILAISLISFLIMETGRLYVLVHHLKNDIDFANMAVWRELDQQGLAYGIYRLHQEGETENEGHLRAKNTFLDFLAGNMGLNRTSLVSLHPDSPLIGAVEIQDFQVYLKEDLPANAPNGSYVDKVSVYSRIKVTIKPIFQFFGDSIEKEISIISNLEDEL